MGNYHDWSEEDFDWKGLAGATRIIRDTLRFFRIGCYIKEKYGTIRCTISCFNGSLHSLIYPGYTYTRFPDCLGQADWYLAYRIMNKVPFKWIVAAIQLIQLHIGYRLAYYLAMRKYPHLKEEICVDADYPNYIIGGQEIHDKYWEAHKNEV